MFQRIEGFIWLDWVVEKLEEKHGVEPDEVIFANEMEEAEFWDTHDSIEFLNDTEAIDVIFVDARPSSSDVLLRFDPATANKLKRIAHQKGLDFQALIQLWIQEKVAQESR